jgi:hypothetical protein
MRYDQHSAIEIINLKSSLYPSVLLWLIFAFAGRGISQKAKAQSATVPEQAFLVSAFSRSHREKRGGFLLHVLTATMRALGIFMIVLGQSENGFERLMTIEANVIVNGHGNLPWGMLIGEL